MSTQRGLLSDAEIDALPDDLRAHYQTASHVRDLDDLQYFPEPLRSRLQDLADRARVRADRRIAQVDAQERRAAS